MTTQRGKETFIFLATTVLLLFVGRYTFFTAQTPTVGDVDSDGDVDILDDYKLLADFSKRQALPSDLDHDSDVDVYDYNVLLTNFGRGQNTPTPTPTSEGELDISICDPSRGAGAFSLTIDNPFLPFPVGMVHVIEGGGAKVQISVLNQTEVVAGVTTRVVEEREWVNNQIVEISRNFFVQAPDGTVCYYGEDVDIYTNGQITGHSGAWRAGVGQNKPGILMPANPAVGMKYMQEMAPGIAMDRGEILAMGETYTTPAGTFTDVMRVLDTTLLSDTQDLKRYQRGIGMIYDAGMELTQQ